MSNCDKIFICDNSETLRSELLKYKRTITIEAEYGDDVVCGSVLTLAHHGEKFSSCLTPCLITNDPIMGDVDAIGISHFDLDTFGALLAIVNGNKILPHMFWKIEAMVDVLGTHKCEEFMSVKIDNEEVRSYTIGNIFDAYYAFSEHNGIITPQDHSVKNVFDDYMKYRDFIAELYIHDSKSPLLDLHETSFMRKGVEWRKNLNSLIETSFVKRKNGVVLRSSDKFVNNLYSVEDIAIVGYNTTTGKITLSTDDKIDNFDCCSMMKMFFGDSAGGRQNIAGSPRNENLGFDEAEMLFDYASDHIVDVKSLNNSNKRTIIPVINGEKIFNVTQVEGVDLVEFDPNKT